MKRGTRRRLTLELLETRTLLSTCNVTRLGDFGAGATLGDFSRGDFRYCFTQANDNPGPDTINININGTIQLESALPRLVGDTTINGPGADLLTIDAQQKARVLFIASGASVEVSGVTMTGGRELNGAGIYNDGMLVLRDSTVTQNLIPGGNGHSGAGGGILNTGTLWLWECTISGNTVDTQYGFGGGIYNSGTLMVHGSDIWNNKLPATQYSGYVKGGGIDNRGQTTVIDSTIHSNIAIGGAYGIGGGIHSDGGTLNVHSSLIAGNTVYSDAAFGGGIGTGFGDTTVANSTVVQNLTLSGPWESDVGAYGAGLYQKEDRLTVSSSTAAQNQASGRWGYGGGVYINGHAEIVMQNSIVAENTAATDYDDFVGNDHFLSYNLIGGSPMLGPLQDNGGPTLTMALLPGSPAIDAGDPAPEDPPEWDQRGPGFPRIANGRIDIGAFEVQATGAPLPSADFTVLITSDFETIKAKRKR